jgi:hypothetical protein
VSSPKTNTDDRYRPPRAPVSDAPLKPRVNVWDIVIVLGLLAMWLLDFPHDSISRFIGQHFPWPVERSLKWPALLLERTLIEAGVCIPAALVLALRLRRYAVVIAVLLTVVFCGRIAFEVSEAIPGSFQWRFLLVIAGMHTALLVSATAFFAYLARRLRRSRTHTG